MTPATQKLHAIFGQAGWQRFINSLLDYRYRGKPFPAIVTLRQPTEDERQLQARLLRLPAQRGAIVLRYDLIKLSAALEKSGLESDWDIILELLRGPIPEKFLAARAEKKAWEEFWPQMEKLIGKTPFDLWAAWLAGLKRDGILKRLSKGDVKMAEQHLTTSAKLLRAVPFLPERSLADTAAEYCNGSHALDPSMPLSTLVLRALALRLGQTVPTRSDSRRSLWAAFGVVCDELSAPVLVYNLNFASDTLLSRLISSASAENQPLHLTTRMIWSTEWSHIKYPFDVYVCENPTVLSMAASQFGQKSPPLVCVNGEPGTAARALLRQLKSCGAQLHYHGDFDWPGISIARRIIEELGASPWFFDADAYRAASRYQGRELTDKPSATPWCPQLAIDMQQQGVAYDEEILAIDLLAAVSGL